jgi:hypothetical protein
MARKRLPQGEKKGILTIYIEEKYLTGNKDELRTIAYEAVVKHSEK